MLAVPAAGVVAGRVVDCAAEVETEAVVAEAVEVEGVEVEAVVERACEPGGPNRLTPDCNKAVPNA